MSIRAWYRLVGFALITLFHFSRFMILAIGSKDRTSLALRLRRRWANAILPFLGIELSVYGTPPEEACILVGNHISYIDPVAVLHDVLAWPVAKAEVSKWPLIGNMAKNTGILFVERENRNSRADTIKAIDAAVKRGLQIMIYPEGTTNAEPKTLPFRRGAFRLAAKEGFAIYPMAITYSRADAAWVGDDTFIPHFLRTFRRKRLGIQLSYGPRLQDPDEISLLGKAQSWIDEELVRLSHSSSVD